MASCYRWGELGGTEVEIKVSKFGVCFIIFSFFFFSPPH